MQGRSAGYRNTLKDVHAELQCSGWTKWIVKRGEPNLCMNRTSNARCLRIQTSSGCTFASFATQNNEYNTQQHVHSMHPSNAIHKWITKCSTLLGDDKQMKAAMHVCSVLQQCTCSRQPEGIECNNAMQCIARWNHIIQPHFHWGVLYPVNAGYDGVSLGVSPRSSRDAVPTPKGSFRWRPHDRAMQSKPSCICTYNKGALSAGSVGLWKCHQHYTIKGKGWLRTLSGAAISRTDMIWYDVDTNCFEVRTEWEASQGGEYRHIQICVMPRREGDSNPRYICTYGNLANCWF